jgi:hypothetical protein
LKREICCFCTSIRETALCIIGRGGCDYDIVRNVSEYKALH